MFPSAPVTTALDRMLRNYGVTIYGEHWDEVMLAAVGGLSKESVFKGMPFARKPVRIGELGLLDTVIVGNVRKAELFCRRELDITYLFDELFDRVFKFMPHGHTV